MNIFKYMVWCFVYRGVSKTDHDQLLQGARMVVRCGGPAPQIAKDYIAFYERRYPTPVKPPNPYQEAVDYAPEGGRLDHIDFGEEDLTPDRIEAAIDVCREFDANEEARLQDFLGEEGEDRPLTF